MIASNDVIKKETVNYIWKYKIANFKRLWKTRIPTLETGIIWVAKNNIISTKGAFIWEAFFDFLSMRQYFPKQQSEIVRIHVVMK